MSGIDRQQWFWVLAGGLVLAAGGGCSLDLGEAPFLCNPGKPQCPEGYECKNKYCVKEGTCPDTVPGCASTTCGNGKCEAGEKTTCPKDCSAACGDQGCEASVPDGGSDLQGDWNAPPPDQSVMTPDQPWPPPPDQQGTPGTFGSKCGTCNPPYQCVKVSSGAPTGFCTITCTNSGGPCAGAPSGTGSFCLLTDKTSGKEYCAFLCKTTSQNWPCPPDLTCSPNDNPPGSGQHICMP